MAALNLPLGFRLGNFAISEISCVQLANMMEIRAKWWKLWSCWGYCTSTSGFRILKFKFKFVLESTWVFWGTCLYWCSLRSDPTFARPPVPPFPTATVVTTVELLGGLSSWCCVSAVSNVCNNLYYWSRIKCLLFTQKSDSNVTVAGQKHHPTPY